MGHLRSAPKLSAITFLVAQAFFTLPAFAAGFQINEISTSLQGNAMAGGAAANNDVSSMFINPATLTTLLQNQVYAGGSEILPSIHMSNATATHTVNIPGIIPTSITAPVQGKNHQHNVSQGAFVPDAYFGWRFNDRLVGGLSLTAPFGLKTHYENDSVLRFAADYSAIKTANITPALAYALSDKWSVGVGFQAQYAHATFSNYNGPYTGVPAIDALVASDHPTQLKAHGWGYGYTLGMLFKPDACTRLGIGYRSMVSERLNGDGQQYVMPGEVVPAPNHDFLFNAQTTAKGAIKTPAVLALSAARDYIDWTLKASVHVNFWDTFNHISINMPDAFATNSTIQTHWKNAWFGSLGADYRAIPSWVLRGGVAYDQTPTTNLRDPRIPDNNRFWVNVGASYIVNKNFSIDGAYSHLFIQDQTVNVTQASGSSATSTVPLEVNTVHAKYTGNANIVALAARYSF